jgi:hypothetical protein
VFKRFVERRKIVSTIGFVILALFTIVMIPIGSARWNETLQINGDLNTGLFGLTPPSTRPTFIPFELTASPTPTVNPTMIAFPPLRATPTSFATDYTLETPIIITRAPTHTLSPWPTQTPITPTQTKEPEIDPTATATDVPPSPRPTLGITSTVEIPPILTTEPPTDIPPIDPTPYPGITK